MFAGMTVAYPRGMHLKGAPLGSIQSLTCRHHTGLESSVGEYTLAYWAIRKLQAKMLYLGPELNTFQAYKFGWTSAIY